MARGAEKWRGRATRVVTTLVAAMLPLSAAAHAGEPVPQSSVQLNQAPAASPAPELPTPQLLSFTPDYKLDEVLVRFDSSTDSGDRAAVRADEGAKLEEKLPVPGLQRVKIDQQDTVPEAIQSFERQPGVAYAEPNYLRELRSKTPNDPRFGDLWGQNNTGQSVNNVSGTSDADMDLPEAWDRTTGSSSGTVAVIDSGVAYDNPDLSPNMWTNPGESGGGKENNGVDDDGDGKVDDYRGWN
jgi:subtilisin family serine protease